MGEDAIMSWDDAAYTPELFVKTGIPSKTGVRA